MKKIKFESKLNLKKDRIANLNNVKGGASDTWIDTCQTEVTNPCTKRCPTYNPELPECTWIATCNG